ncbi:hypothetical protein AcW1_005901 [Taiwanofungus camphoratus]|nr:hypothetical protein AcW2_004655 [Antrodia cinnamomea]KAI0934345.1 hypothetical protein AcV5_006216 [Antrodia cinnamomea]KAI0950363.1 hypothetical protein AcV7_008854 [Antrodia cinnamomea]KAI0957543.1 hypothetical protein AcW1_005901 [Antrodia cinnamomea]
MGQRPRGTQLFHQIGIVVLTIATIAYFSMASDLGATPVRAEFSRGNTYNRQIFYVRYIQWFITLPLILLEMLLATGLTLSDIFTTVFMGWVFVIFGLVGAFVPSTYKWGYYVIGIFSMFYVWWMLLGHGICSTFAAGGVVRTGYMHSASCFCFIMMLYPICWGCAEGRNVISPMGEMIWYGILDLFAGPIFLFLFLWTLREVDIGAFSLYSGKYTDTMYGADGAGVAPGMTVRTGNGVTGVSAPVNTSAAPAASTAPANNV